jgi:hypothetical protein
MFSGLAVTICGLLLYVLLLASVGFCDFPQTVQAIKTPPMVQGIQTPPIVQAIQTPPTIQGIQTPNQNYDSTTGLKQSVASASIANSYGAIPVLLYGLNRFSSKTLTSGSSTTSIKITSHGAVAGQFIQMLDGVAQFSTSRICAIPDANTITACDAFNASPASGDHALILTAMPIGGTAGSTNGDKGTAIDVSISTQAGNGNGSNFGAAFLLKREDDGHGSGDAGIAAWSRRVSTFGTSAGSDNDYATIDSDLDGRLATNAQGAAPGQTLQGCTAAIANGTPVAVATATTSTRYYVNGFKCNNQNTTATEVQLLDGATVIDDCWAPSNAISQDNCVHSHTGMPLRGTANTALNVKTVTDGASVKCCINGYTSGN